MQPSRLRVLLAAVLATLLGLGLRAAYAGGMPENAVVVVNADSWASMRVANEYVRLRQIPTANVIYLPGLSDFERVGIEEFRQQVLLPVLQAVKERGLDGQIDYVLYSADFPTAIGVSADVGSRKLPRIFTQDAAVNGLTYLHRFVLDKDIRYLDLNSNLYARRVLRQASDTLWTADEQHRYGEAVQQLSAVSARKSGKAQEQAKLTDEEVKAKLVSALEVMRDLKRAHPHSAELLYNLACCLALMGNADEAVAALREAAGAGWWDYRHASRDDDLKALRERADFKELLAKIKDTTFEIQPTVGFRASASERPPYLISTMLACTSGRGNSVSEALASLRRSAEADHTRPKGTIYFMENGDIRSTTREWAFRAAVEKLKQLGVNAVVEQGVLPQNKPDVAGAVIGAAGFDWAKSGSAMLPGAICEHLTSFGGALRETAGQTPLSEFLRHGAAAASGTVTEPYAIQAKFPNAFIQVHYPRGCTLGEAFYQSVNGPYQLLIVGDALCKPWATKVEVRAHGPRFEGHTLKNENWAKFNFQGVTPPEALGGTVRITPQASYGDGVKPALYELYLDGRRVMTAKPGESFEFDTTKVADGPHELSVISTGDDAIASQGRLAVPVVVRNGPDMLEVVGPPASEVPWDKPIELRAKLSAAGEIVLYHNVGLMRRIAGPEGSFQVDPRTLGQGPVRLQAVGVVAGRQVWGNPIDLTIVPPPALPAVQTPDEKGLTAGFRITVPDKPSVVADKIDAESLARAGLEKDRDFAVEAFFRVPEDDVYQFQVRGHANIRKMLVDGQAQDWPRGKEWWFVPVHLAKGLHQLRIEGRAIDRPNLDIRFGGPGGRKLDAKRTPIWYCSP